MLLVTFFLFLPAAAAESSLRLLSNVAQEVKGRGTISWIDCGYVICCFLSPSLHPPHSLLACIADLALMVALKLVACGWTHTALCSFCITTGSLHLTTFVLPSCTWWGVVFPLWLVVTSVTVCFQPKAGDPSYGIAFHGGHIAWKHCCSFPTSRVRKNPTCYASAGGQHSSARTADVACAIGLVDFKVPKHFCFSGKCTFF